MKRMRFARPDSEFPVEGSNVPKMSRSISTAGKSDDVL